MSSAECQELINKATEISKCMEWLSGENVSVGGTSDTDEEFRNDVKAAYSNLANSFNEMIQVILEDSCGKTESDAKQIINEANIYFDPKV